LLLAAVTLPVAASADDGDERVRAAAAAAGASAYVRADEDGRRAYVRVRGNGARSRRGASARASTSGGKGSARASARAREVSVFSGLVTAERVSVAVSASGGSSRASGSVERLRIDGRRRRVPTRGASFDMAGYGRLVALRRDGGSIIGLRARLTKDYGAHEAGSAVNIAYASASARDAPPPEREPEPKRDEDEGGDRPERERRDSAADRRRRRAERLVRELKAGDYVFPVRGEHTYTDDYGAPREFTGKHEGNDIFAVSGTPVVAVANGRLFLVGTRRISGNRLWLEDSEGNQFFYAHLTSFAEIARNGVEVEQGDVLGYVGSTGDAEQTPPHLHFEVHPRGGGPVNPFELLRAWDGDSDTEAAAQPGTLVVVDDYLER
jgi:murein DD-endopeptidase MepM/ murein hydrolase activator NlpD